MKLPVSELGLPTRLVNRLKAEGIEIVSDFATSIAGNGTPRSPANVLRGVDEIGKIAVDQVFNALVSFIAALPDTSAHSHERAEVACQPAPAPALSTNVLSDADILRIATEWQTRSCTTTIILNSEILDYSRMLLAAAESAIRADERAQEQKRLADWYAWGDAISERAGYLFFLGTWWADRPWRKHVQREETK